MQVSRGKLSLMACESGKLLSNRIVEVLRKIYKDDFALVNSQETTFANGEIKTILNQSVRGDDLYIVQCMDDPLSDKTVNDNFLALLTAVDAAYQSDAEQITVVIPQFPYSRQERRKARECITAKLIAKMLEEAGADRVVTMDVHADAIQGFFDNTKFENLHATREIIDHFNRNYSDTDFMVVAPDVGSAERARFFAQNFGKNLAIIDKVRNYAVPGTIESMTLVGNVEGYNVFIGDDMIATGGTIISACKLLKDRGAKDIYLACTFPFFNGNAVEKFDKAYEKKLIKKLIGTDAVFRGQQFSKDHPWYDEVSTAEIFAKVMYNINMKISLSALLK